MSYYNNFTEAWAAWLDYQQSTVSWDLIFASDNHGYAAYEGFTEQGFLYLLDAFAYLFDAVLYHIDFLDDDYKDSSHFAAVWYAWEEGGATSMSSILTAMLQAKNEEITQFIGIEQAYMSAIWNAPFNADYYAALARGWRQWQ